MNNPFLDNFSEDEFDVIDRLIKIANDLKVDSISIFTKERSISIVGRVNGKTVWGTGTSLTQASQSYVTQYNLILKKKTASAA